MPAVDWTISLCIIGGALLAFQAGINGTLNVKARSGIFASLWSFMSGLIPLIFYWLGESKGGKETDFRATYQDAPLYAHWGGVMGCGYVLMICFLAPRLGAATILATAVASQMAAALIMDHFGWLGLEQREATAGRIIGVLLTIVGVALIMGGFAYVKGLFTSKPKDVPAQQPRKSNSLESDVEKGSDIGIVPVNPKLGSFDWTIIFAVLGGIALAFQATMNGKLGAYSGGGYSAAFSFFQGTILLIIVLIYDMRFGPTSRLKPQWSLRDTIKETPKWGWLGGLLGAAYVLIITICIPRLGAATVLGTAVCSQSVMAIIADHYALVGLPLRRASLERLAGTCVIIGGVVLITVL